MAIASNGCNSVSTTISIQLTDCPTCHHTEKSVLVVEDEVKTPAPVTPAPAPVSHHTRTTHHSGAAAAAAAASGPVDDAAAATTTTTTTTKTVVVVDESASADKWSTISMTNGSTTGVCRVPR